MSELKIAMISSTVRDLPEHREKVRDACLRQEFFPSLMENWPALDADGIKASLEKVDKADIYIGIFGFRYGYIPKGQAISITEMEYNRAKERDIPRLIFLMDEKHPITVEAVERGENSEKVDALRSQLPNPEAEPHILVTSRTEHGSFVPVPLDPLDLGLSLELLVLESGRNLRSESEKEAAKEIAEKLGGLPLALELAGAYLRHRPTAWEQYRDLLNHNLKAALPAKFLQGSFTKHEADLYSTLRINSEVFSDEPLLKDVLDVLTWSGPGSMGISLLSDLLNIPEPNLTNALGLGRSLRLLHKVPGSESYSLHQLVRDVRREDVLLKERTDWTLTIVKRLVGWFQKLKRNFLDLPKFQSEIEHLKAWLINLEMLSPKLASRLIWLQAYPPFHTGKFKDSLDFLLRAKEVLANSSETDPDLEGNLFTDLCTIYGSLGEYFKAKECGLSAVQIRLSLLGEEHADTAMSFNNIGGTFRILGDPKSGLEYCERALKVWQKVQGEKHIDTALALDNVAASYRDLKNSALALEFALKALSVREEVLGCLHPDTASSLSQVGVSYADLGKFDDALDHQKRALAASEELFGKRSALRAHVLQNTGGVYHKAGNYKSAFQNFAEALEIRLELFGDKHPQTIISAVDCCWTHCLLAQIHQGHQMLKEWVKKIPRDHPSHQWLKEEQRKLERQFPRPGFRQHRH